MCIAEYMGAILLVVVPQIFLFKCSGIRCDCYIMLSTFLTSLLTLLLYEALSTVVFFPLSVSLCPSVHLCDMIQDVVMNDLHWKTGSFI